jgi:hypothetical protein
MVPLLEVVAVVVAVVVVYRRPAQKTKLQWAAVVVEAVLDLMAAVLAVEVQLDHQQRIRTPVLLVVQARLLRAVAVDQGELFRQRPVLLVLEVLAVGVELLESPEKQVPLRLVLADPAAVRVVRVITS